MEVNLGDKFKLENFRPIVANKSELEVSAANLLCTTLEGTYTIIFGNFELHLSVHVLGMIFEGNYLANVNLSKHFN